MFKNKTEDGFTLIEVLAAMVILTMLIIGSLGLFNFTQKASVSNNEKFVAVNIAKATIERMKISPTDFYDPKDEALIKNKSEPAIFTKENFCSADDNACKLLFNPEVNGKKYDVEIKMSQDSQKTTGQKYSEKELKIINTRVIVTLPDTKVEAKVEAYIDEEIE